MPQRTTDTPSPTTPLKGEGSQREQETTDIPLLGNKLQRSLGNGSITTGSGAPDVTMAEPGKGVEKQMVVPRLTASGVHGRWSWQGERKPGRARVGGGLQWRHSALRRPAHLKPWLLLGVSVTAQTSISISKGH